MVPNIRVVPGEYEPVNVCTEEDENVISHQVDIAHNGTIHREKEEKEVTENGVLLDENRRKDVEYEPEENVVGETSFTIAFQVFIPFLIAGLGTVAAGLLLDKVQVNKLTAEGSLALYNLSDVWVQVSCLLGQVNSPTLWLSLFFSLSGFSVMIIMK